MTDKMGTHIKAARISRGLTQQQLADMLKSTPQQIARWESAYSLNTSSLLQITKVLGLTIDSLISGTLNVPLFCRCCGKIIPCGEAMQLGMHPMSPFHCYSCIKHRTAECLMLTEKTLEALK